MKNSSLLLLLFSLQVGGIFAQTKPLNESPPQARLPDGSIASIPKPGSLHHNSIGLSVGALHYRTVDHQMSPLTYYFNVPQATVFWRKQKRKNLIEISVFAGFGKGSQKNIGQRTYTLPKFEDIYGTVEEDKLDYVPAFITGGLKFSWLRKIPVPMRSGDLYIGAQISETLIWSGILFSGINKMSRLDAKFEQQGLITPKVKLRVTGTIPLVGFITRPTYSGVTTTPGNESLFSNYFREGTSLTSWNTHQAIDLSVVVEYKLTNRWYLSGGYDLGWYRISNPKPVVAYTNQISIISTFKF